MWILCYILLPSLVWKGGRGEERAWMSFPAARITTRTPFCLLLMQSCGTAVYRYTAYCILEISVFHVSTGLLLGRVSHGEGASPALAVSDARFLQLQRGCLGRLHEKLPDHWPRHSHLPGIWPWLRKELVCERSVSPQTALCRLFIV